MGHFQAANVTIDEVVAALDADGYAIVEGVLSPDEVQAKRDDLIGVLQSTPAGRNDFEGFKTQRIYNLYAKTRAFDAPAVPHFRPAVPVIMKNITKQR